jgi:hypothetical protein
MMGVPDTDDLARDSRHLTVDVFVVEHSRGTPPVELRHLFQFVSARR